MWISIRMKIHVGGCLEQVTWKPDSRGPLKQSPTMMISIHAFKTVLEIHLYKQYHKWFQILFTCLPCLPSLTLCYIPSVCLCVCVCECACMCVRAYMHACACICMWVSAHTCACVHVCVCVCACKEYNITAVSLITFLGFNVHIIVDLVKQKRRRDMQHNNTCHFCGLFLPPGAPVLPPGDAQEDEAEEPQWQCHHVHLVGGVEKLLAL